MLSHVAESYLISVLFTEDDVYGPCSLLKEKLVNSLLVQLAAGLVGAILETVAVPTSNKR